MLPWLDLLHILDYHVSLPISLSKHPSEITLIRTSSTLPVNIFSGTLGGIFHRENEGSSAYLICISGGYIWWALGKECIGPETAGETNSVNFPS